MPRALRDCQHLFRGSDFRFVRTKYGFKIGVDLNDWLGRHVYVTGDYEPATSRLIWNFLSQGDTFIDVGANVGFFTLLAAKRVGALGRVVSCEPVPYVRSCLVENIQRNGFTNCEVHSEAASNCSAECEFFQGPRNHVGVSSLGAIEDASAVLSVTAKRLDDLLDVQQVSVIKIDVEGAECHVLEGLRTTLARHQPDLIVEITPRYLKRLGRSTTDIERILFKLDYQCYAIESSGLKPLSTLMADDTAQFNALFTTRDSGRLGLRA